MKLESLGLALACVLGIALAPARAAAETVCSTVSEFNAYMAENATHSEDVTLSFDLVGVKPSDFHNGKGALAQMRNTECNGGAEDSVIKVYGTSDTFNSAHPPGTLKLEYGSQCCTTSCGEHWADPNASAVIFSDGSEQCKVTMWNRPDSIGYKLECSSGTFEAVGDNSDQNVVNQIALLEYFTADGGTTWELPNATAGSDQVCYVRLPDNSQTMTLPVAEDVSSGPSFPSTVFPDLTDLAVEAGDVQAFLKFVVPPIAGKITQAKLLLHTRTESFSAGDGAEVHALTSNDWSESTLTWNTRPALAASSLGRIGPAAADQAVSLDLGGAISGPGTYGFALVSPPTDTNGTHFFSKEGSPSSGPSLKISFEVVDADADGTPDGPDCDDSDPSVQSCDNGTAGGWTSSGGSSGVSNGTGGSNASADDEALAGGCAFSVQHDHGGWLFVALAALVLSAIRRRARS
jgi:hypothetical protein